MKNNKKPRMNVSEVMDDMRSRGFSIGYKNLILGIEKGLYPFIRVMSVSPNGRKSFLIYRKEYEAWAIETLGPVMEEKAV